MTQSLNQADVEEVHDYLGFVLKRFKIFKQHSNNLSEEIEELKAQLDYLEKELNTEVEKTEEFIASDIKPIGSKLEEGNHQEAVDMLWRIMEDENQMERLIDKLRGDMDGEIDTLKSFGSDIQTVETEATKAEEAVEKLENKTKELKRKIN